MAAKKRAGAEAEAAEGAETAEVVPEGTGTAEGTAEGAETAEGTETGADEVSAAEAAGRAAYEAHQGTKSAAVLAGEPGWGQLSTERQAAWIRTATEP